MVEQSYSPQGRYGGQGETTGDKVHPSNTFLQAGKIGPCVHAKSQNSHAEKRDNCPMTFIYIVWHVCVYTQEEEEEEKTAANKGLKRFLNG